MKSHPRLTRLITCYWWHSSFPSSRCPICLRLNWSNPIIRWCIIMPQQISLNIIFLKKYQLILKWPYGNSIVACSSRCFIFSIGFKICIDRALVFYRSYISRILWRILFALSKNSSKEKGLNWSGPFWATDTPIYSNLGRFVLLSGDIGTWFFRSGSFEVSFWFKTSFWELSDSDVRGFG